MSKLDDIETKLNRLNIGWAVTVALTRDEIHYLLQVARKAEEMAKFYAEMPEKNVEFSDYKSMVDQYSAKEANKIGYKAREFLSFLEKGE